MKTLFTIVFICLVSTLRSQDSLSFKSKKDTAQYLIKLIEKNGSLQSFGTGFAGTPSKQYFRFIFLLTLLDNKEFVDLVKSSKGALKVYSYMALYHNKYENLSEITRSIEEDTTLIGTVSGCLGDPYTVSYIIDHLDNWYWEIQTNQILSEIRTNKAQSKSYYNWVLVQN